MEEALKSSDGYITSIKKPYDMPAGNGRIIKTSRSVTIQAND